MNKLKLNSLIKKFNDKAKSKLTDYFINIPVYKNGKTLIKKMLLSEATKQAVKEMENLL